ncbi:MAG: FtsX-like permease family protein [Magnetococcales bacterium]|nr:FtsX-like permease family protein [Magnetococcales bacterium]
MNVTLTIAIQGIKGAWRDCAFFSLALFLAVAAMTGLIATGNTLTRVIDRDARAMLGADLRLESASPFDTFIDTHLRAPGRTVAVNLEFSAMIHVPGSNRAVLAEILAADPQHPLRGSVELRSGQPLQTALNQHGAVAEIALASRLDLRTGDAFRLGEAEFHLTDLLQHEPDRILRFFRWGPRLVIPKNRAAATGLLTFGSRVQYVALVRLRPDETPDSLAAHLRPLTANNAIRVMTPAESQPSAQRFIQRFSIFLGAITLLTILATGTAMAGAMTAHAREQRSHIAILKLLGASHAQITRIFLTRILLIALPAILAGTAIGLLAPYPITGWQDGPRLDLGSAWQGALLGAAAALFFSLGPLRSTRSVSPASLLRNVHWRGGLELLPWPWRWGMPLLGACGCALFLAWRNGWPALRLFAAELVATPLLLGLVTTCGLLLLRRWNPATLPQRMAIRNLTASRNGTASAIVTVAIGLGALCAILFLERNLDWQLVSRLPKRTPSFFLIDLLPDQLPLARQLAAPFLDHPNDWRATPVVRGRIRSLNGQPVTPDSIADHPNAWRFTRDYVLTWSAELPPGNRILAGRWWSDPLAHEASLETEMARSLGLGIGDTIGFDIMGIEVTARVTTLREVHWSDMGINFFVVFSPEVLRDAPHTLLGSVALPREREEALRSTLTQRFHNLSLVAVRDVMEAAANMLERLILSVRLAGGMAAVAGLTALGVSVAVTRRRRAREAALHRLLGATPRALLQSAAWEFLFIGGIAALAGVALGQAVTAGVTGILFNDTWNWLPDWTLAALIAATAVTAFIGYATARNDLRRPVMAALRGHE